MKDFFGDVGKTTIPDLLLLGMTLNVLLRPDMVSAILFVAAGAGYLASKFFIDKDKELDFYRRISLVSDRIDQYDFNYISICNNISAMSQEITSLKEQQLNIKKQSEETKKIVADNNLTNVFVPRAKRRENV